MVKITKKILLLLILPFVGFSQQDFYASDSTVFCTGDTITFVFVNNSTDTVQQITWSFGDTTVVVPDTVAYHVYGDTGTYTVSAIVLYTNSNSDTIVKPFYITIKDTTGIDFVIDNNGLPSSQFFFVATDTNGVFDWNIDGEIFTDTTYRFFYAFSTYGDKQVTLIQKVAYNCEAVVTKSLKVENVLKAPNIFTPNDDGINDFFEIKTNGNDIYQLSIFNRYGEIVFQITSKRPYWDGRTSAGVKVTNGVYYYILENVSGKQETVKGFVYLIR